MKQFAIHSKSSHFLNTSLAQCPKCNGCLVGAYVDRGDMSESVIPGTPIILARCINCGECVDNRILSNRLKAQSTHRNPRDHVSMQEMPQKSCPDIQISESLTINPEVQR